MNSPIDLDHKQPTRNALSLQSIGLMVAGLPALCYVGYNLLLTIGKGVSGYTSETRRAALTGIVTNTTMPNSILLLRYVVILAIGIILLTVGIASCRVGDDNY